jgi:hypothetical protein
MNAGLGNLDSLKKHLLSSRMTAEKRFDQVIQDIGLGVAAEFEKACNRKFARLVDDTYIVSADRVHVYLPRYPFESITSVEFKSDEVTGWMIQPAPYIVTKNLESGLVFLGAAVGPYWAHMRFTYIGGFWFENLEPDDAAYPSQAPAGATVLPDDLRLAWLLQCRNVWDSADKLGAGLIDKPKVQSALAELELSPRVKQTLTHHVRYAMT